VIDNIKKLEEFGMISKQDNYESFVHDIAQEISNRATIKENQRKEIARLKQAIEKLKKNSAYTIAQIKDYQTYLDNSIKGQTTKKKGFKPKTYKYSYKELLKLGVIIDSKISTLVQKLAKFVIAPADAGTFEIKGKLGALAAETITLNLAHFLELHNRGIDRTDIGEDDMVITLGVKPTIDLMNKIIANYKK